MGLIKKEEVPDEEEEEVPPVVKELMEVDDQYLALDEECRKAIAKLEAEYRAKAQPFLVKRQEILKKGEDKKSGTPALNSFWAQAMMNHPAINDLVHPYDEEVLEYLRDIEHVLPEGEDPSLGASFTLRFHFVENPFFTNTVLEKEYVMSKPNPYNGEVDADEIKATKVEWKEGKDVTVEAKKAKSSKGGAKKKPAPKKETIQARPSFFRDFFRNLKPGCDLSDDAKQMAMMIMQDEDMDEEDMGLPGDEHNDDLIASLMDFDHQAGSAFKDHIVPYAVRWFTGEACPEDSDDEDDEDEESEEEGDSDEDETESESEDVKKSSKKGNAACNKPKGGKPNEECKQQ